MQPQTDFGNVIVAMLLGCCGVDWTLRETGRLLYAVRARHSDRVARFRLLSSRYWIKVLLAQVIYQWRSTATPGRQRLVVVNGITVQGPGAKDRVGIGYIWRST
ncbi:hypothetical protein LRD18_11075 [Halorhodospira halochloris]|uniref:hypothetical protein n=1 Tax=Halorhodospira halochloris TaxID=1052 RepID=UPI001EE7C287|nr:hypothetical protein [Halorhodospira halochloris]MCG5531390.1 hypothetical protein [Halorhodospira halochloris]MCG5549193.1 hypothetical protein [Halorhodospira halochloris]